MRLSARPPAGAQQLESAPPKPRTGWAEEEAPQATAGAARKVRLMKRCDASPFFPPLPAPSPAATAAPLPRAPPAASTPPVARAGGGRPAAPPANAVVASEPLRPS